MKNKLITLSGVILAAALGACSSPYEGWESPNVVRRNQPAARNAPSSQVQPEFDKPTGIKKQRASRTQVQPEFAKPKSLPKTSVVKPEAPKPPVVVAKKTAPSRTAQVQPTLPKQEAKKNNKKNTAPQQVVVVKKKPSRSTQVQPTMVPKKNVEQPKPVVQPTSTRRTIGVPFSVMPQEAKKDYPVMPGQNRALKRRR